MARSVLPNPLERRHVVERELSAEQALRIAEAYLAEGRGWEAIVFLLKAGASDRLETLRDEAERGGDFFLFRELTRALEDDPPSERWRAVSEAAAAAGKERYAEAAARQAQRGEG
ncbi:MAG: hypothetical protein QNK03_05860 [Myxococcota bacterium]|nr:hypothetical protein [Myxococcota bacterium]